jgi:hypothetical protein
LKSKHLIVDDIKNMLENMKKEAEFVYRYGGFATLDKTFLKLENTDKLLLLYIALTEGDEDIKHVANELKLLSRVTFSNINELRTKLVEEDIEMWLATKAKIKSLFDEQDIEKYNSRISEELKKACDEIGYLAVENALWVLIPSDLSEDAIWYDATEHLLGNYKVSFPDSVNSNLSEDETNELIELMKNAALVLHIHNHPPMNQLLPSVGDRSFSATWKYKDPLFNTGMLKFFIVQEHVALEYLGRKTKRWLGTLKGSVMEGKAPYIFDNGTKYIGQWKNGLMHGVGKYIYSKTKTYVGGFVDGKLEGEGVLIDLSYKYDGGFKIGQYHGFGTIAYPDGSGYTGNWFENLKHGTGEEYLPTGEKYIGTWEKGFKVAAGIYIDRNGKEKMGKWIEYDKWTEDSQIRVKEFVTDRALFKTKIELPKKLQ